LCNEHQVNTPVAIPAGRGRLWFPDMKVLLRNRRTKLYYLGHNQLGVKHEQAVDFGNIPRAATFTLQEELPDMEIVLRYESCDGEVPLPVLPDWGLLEKGALRPAKPSAPTVWGSSLPP
jgi:hypothetical protein